MLRTEIKFPKAKELEIGGGTYIAKKEMTAFE